MTGAILTLLLLDGLNCKLTCMCVSDWKERERENERKSKRKILVKVLSIYPQRTSLTTLFLYWKSKQGNYDYQHNIERNVVFVCDEWEKCKKNLNKYAPKSFPF